MDPVHLTNLLKVLVPARDISPQTSIVHYHRKKTTVPDTIEHRVLAQNHVTLTDLDLLRRKCHDRCRVVGQDLDQVQINRDHDLSLQEDQDLDHDKLLDQIPDQGPVLFLHLGDPGHILVPEDLVQDHQDYRLLEGLGQAQQDPIRVHDQGHQNPDQDQENQDPAVDHLETPDHGLGQTVDLEEHPDLVLDLHHFRFHHHVGLDLGQNQVLEDLILVLGALDQGQ